MATPAIAIFDIGKTNKKLTLFDPDYHVLYEDDRQFQEIEDDDGFACENLEEVSLWVKKMTRDLKKIDNYDVKAINVSAYGASLVHLDEKGNPATPLYNYLKPYPEDVLSQFYNDYGDRESFALQTASPPMGMLNSGLQLYWLKYKKPHLFQNIKRSLHLPQYFSYLIHKKMYSEITSIGCHTGMWNYQSDQSHDWIYKEKLTSLLPPIVPTHTFEEISSKGRSIICGVGIHDSSAALVPYLLGFVESFMLISTGTWNITLNPFNQEELTVEELRRDCLNYMDYRGTPVKASRIFLGKEHDYQEKRLAAHFSKSPKYHQSVSLDQEILSQLLAQQHPAKKFYPQTMQHTGPLPDYTGPETDLSQFKTYEEAYHQLVLDLVNMQVISLKLAKGNTSLEKVFISGGFCNNRLFMQLLASYFPDIDFYTTNLKRASALGAALVLHRHWNRDTSIEHLLSFEKIQPLQVEELHQYQIA